ncbi:hypothetical protein F9802_14115 [Bacillus aerolatus]|uniref:Uncharacterized protein n=1 Tax=Bacillus aerolatus TaxID=2653354 RepID=A0A6I1FCN8_9BACI|nr:hypothetical protein [Bacillus aerolatus]KAB7705240.1 hypothetical protein F9802_14115 [Bacillus aerolatus]
MEKSTIQPLILLALIFSGFSMGLYSYSSYEEEQWGRSALFAALCICFIGVSLYGWCRNKQIRK